MPLRPAHCQSPANGCPVHDGDDNYVDYDNYQRLKLKKKQVQLHGIS